jgi:Spy/CpxP family protein refolding chaperone
MKKIYLVMFALLLSGTMAMAQTQQNEGRRRGFDPSKMAEMRTEQMAKELSLTADQKTAVLSLYKEFSNKMRPQMGKPGAQPSEKPDKTKMEEMHKQMEAQRAAFNTRMQKILTPAQYKQYVQNEAQHHQRGGRPQMPQNN